MERTDKGVLQTVKSLRTDRAGPCILASINIFSKEDPLPMVSPNNPHPQCTYHTLTPYSFILLFFFYFVVPNCLAQYIYLLRYKYIYIYIKKIT